MKFVLSTLSVPALVLGAALVLTPTPAKAAVDIGVRIDSRPPPPGVIDHRWQRPYRTAVWIAPHYEWNGDRWYWVRGYYAYPPRPGAVYIPARYRHGYYRPGRWSY